MKLPSSVVHVVDDDLSMREAVAALLRSIGLNARTYASATEFLDRAASPADTAQCLVLDVRMPGCSGLELQRQLAQTDCPLPIVFITGHGDIPMTVRAMKAGAVEFLPKPFRDQDLLDAIETALAASSRALQAHQQRQQLKAKHDALTPREKEVVQLLHQGLRNKQIAHHMGISEVTVKVHRHHIMDKMQARSLPMLMSLLEQMRTL